VVSCCRDCFHCHVNCTSLPACGECKASSTTACRVLWLGSRRVESLMTCHSFTQLAQPPVITASRTPDPPVLCAALENCKQSHNGRTVLVVPLCVSCGRSSVRRMVESELVCKNSQGGLLVRSAARPSPFGCAEHRVRVVLRTSRDKGSSPPAGSMHSMRSMHTNRTVGYPLTEVTVLLVCSCSSLSEVGRVETFRCKLSHRVIPLPLGVWRPLPLCVSLAEWPPHSNS